MPFHFNRSHLSTQYGAFDGVDILRGDPVNPVSGGLGGSQLQGEHVKGLVASDGLGNDGFDRPHWNFVRALFGSDPHLVVLCGMEERMKKEEKGKRGKQGKTKARKWEK